MLKSRLQFLMFAAKVHIQSVVNFKPRLHAEQ